MSLSPDDVQTISALLDEKLGRIQAAERRRRRFWLWFWVALFVLSSVASWLAVRQIMAQVQAQVALMDDQMRDAKLAYQAELKRSLAMQQERKVAEQASQYQSKQDQGSYEAGLIRMAFQAMSKQAELTKRMEALDGSDPDALIDATNDMSENLTQSMMALTQILLRNTDPAHNTKAENLLASEAEGAAPTPAPAPVIVPDAPVEKP